MNKQVILVNCSANEDGVYEGIIEYIKVDIDDIELNAWGDPRFKDDKVAEEKYGYKFYGFSFLTLLGPRNKKSSIEMHISNIETLKKRLQHEEELLKQLQSM